MRRCFRIAVLFALIAGAANADNAESLMNKAQAAHAKGLIANAILIGVDLGPNLSVTGSLATILWLLALRKEKLDVSFWRFLKVGAVAMPAALLLSISGAILMQMLYRTL